MNKAFRPLKKECDCGIGTFRTKMKITRVKAETVNKINEYGRVDGNSNAAPVASAGAHIIWK